MSLLKALFRYFEKPIPTEQIAICDLKAHKLLGKVYQKTRFKYKIVPAFHCQALCAICGIISFNPPTFIFQRPPNDTELTIYIIHLLLWRDGMTNVADRISKVMSLDIYE